MDDWLPDHSWLRDKDGTYHLVPDTGPSGPPGTTLCRRLLWEFPDDGGYVEALYKPDDTLNIGVNPPVDQSCTLCLERRSEILGAS